MLGIRGLSAAAMLAGVTLIVIAILPGSDRRARHLLHFLVVNLALVTVLSLTTQAFHAFSSNYNAWALPVVALLAATALIHSNRYIRIVSALSITVIFTADCYAALRLSTAGATYGHTRSSVLKDAIDSAGKGNAIVI